MSQKYDLKSLIKAFNKHAAQAEENRQKIISDFKAAYPNEEVPAYMTDDFNLPMAMASMAEYLDLLMSDYNDR